MAGLAEAAAAFLCSRRRVTKPILLKNLPLRQLIAIKPQTLKMIKMLKMIMLLPLSLAEWTLGAMISRKMTIFSRPTKHGRFPPLLSSSASRMAQRWPGVLCSSLYSLWQA